jgi:hypothetical protein
VLLPGDCLVLLPCQRTVPAPPRPVPLAHPPASAGPAPPRRASPTPPPASEPPRSSRRARHSCYSPGEHLPILLASVLFAPIEFRPCTRQSALRASYALPHDLDPQVRCAVDSDVGNCCKDFFRNPSELFIVNIQIFLFCFLLLIIDVNMLLICCSCIETDYYCKQSNKKCWFML